MLSLSLSFRALDQFLALHAGGHDGPASRLLWTPDRRQVGLSKIMHFLSPYTGGDDNLIVEKTPAADVHVDDAELCALLLWTLAIVQFVFLFGGWNLVVGQEVKMYATPGMCVFGY